jgi:hypothetical protein
MTVIPTGFGTTIDRANPIGWSLCNVRGHESPWSSRPSRSFITHDEKLRIRNDMTTISVTDLGELLQPGRYRTWVECRDELSDRYIGKL